MNASNGNINPESFYPYSKQIIDKSDIEAVVQVLQQPMITTGPYVDEFEAQLQKVTNSKYACAVSSGTAALHLAMRALDIDESDEVITSPITFLATAASVRYCNGKLVLADVDPNTGLLDINSVKQCITKQTKAIITVDLAGRPSVSEELLLLCKENDIKLVQDAAHSLGSEYNQKRLGEMSADIIILSFHPVKHITTGEGGALLTNDYSIAKRVKCLRSHAMVREPEMLSQNPGPWWYEMNELGYNYRITDIQCALGISQLRKLSDFIAARNKIAKKYNLLFSEVKYITTSPANANILHAYHLYQLQIDFIAAGCSRKELMQNLRSVGIGTQVHYIPLYKQPYFRSYGGWNEADFPGSETFYARTISIPCYPSLNADELIYISNKIKELIK